MCKQRSSKSINLGRIRIISFNKSTYPIKTLGMASSSSPAMGTSALLPLLLYTIAALQFALVAARILVSKLHPPPLLKYWRVDMFNHLLSYLSYYMISKLHLIGNAYLMTTTQVLLASSFGWVAFGGGWTWWQPSTGLDCTTRPFSPSSGRLFPKCAGIDLYAAISSSKSSS